MINCEDTTPMFLHVLINVLTESSVPLSGPCVNSSMTKTVDFLEAPPVSSPQSVLVSSFVNNHFVTP